MDQIFFVTAFLIFLSLNTWSFENQRSLGLQKKGLTHTVSAALFDRIAEMQTPEDFKKIENFDQ